MPNQDCIDRSEAKQRDLNRYFTGKPCSRGHIAERITANGCCWQCVMDDKLKKRSAREGYRSRAEITATTNLQTRECIACHTVHPTTAEFFITLTKKQPGGTIWHGFARECRTCRNKRFAPFYEANREQQIERVVAYGRKHQAARNARDMLRYVSRLKATPPWANLDRIRLMYEDATYLTEISGEKYEVDHIHPLQHPKLCGLHASWNMQVITKSANCSKGNRLVLSGDI